MGGSSHPWENMQAPTWELGTVLPRAAVSCCVPLWAAVSCHGLPACGLTLGISSLVVREAPRSTAHVCLCWPLLMAPGNLGWLRSSLHLPGRLAPTPRHGLGQGQRSGTGRAAQEGVRVLGPGVCQGHKKRIGAGLRGATWPWYWWWPGELGHLLAATTGSSVSGQLIEGRRPCVLAAGGAATQMATAPPPGWDLGALWGL